MKKNPYPDVGDLVVCTVKEVKDFGAFTALDEYPGKEGFIHVSEVASGWVKYVRDHVRERAKLVCKVLQVDEKRGHVDLSFKRVNEHQRREKISEWKNSQKAEKLMEILAANMGSTTEKGFVAFGFALGDSFGTLYAAFEAAAIDPDSIKEAGFSGPWVKPFVQLASENISIPFVTIAGYVNVTSPAPDGVRRVREALCVAEKTEYEDVKIEVQYVGAPRYRIRVTAPDYKVAEEELGQAAQRVVAAIKAEGGEGDFTREATKSE